MNIFDYHSESHCEAGKGLLTEVFSFTATTGDSAGNLAFGLTPDEVKLFPEVEANYWVSSGMEGSARTPAWPICVR